jgi:bifunctional DNA-binding transcriptional regulator/antitoxin component of YhaV-PrlF toxin-antitoxin module
MKLQLEQVGEDTVLIFPLEFLARFGWNEGDQLMATVDGQDLHLRPAKESEGDEEAPTD